MVLSDEEAGELVPVFVVDFNDPEIRRQIIEYYEEVLEARSKVPVVHQIDFGWILYEIVIPVLLLTFPDWVTLSYRYFVGALQNEQAEDEIPLAEQPDESMPAFMDTSECQRAQGSNAPNSTDAVQPLLVTSQEDLDGAMNPDSPSTEFIDADIARSGCETSAVTANVGQPSDAVAIESSDRTSISDQTATTTINFRRDYIAEQCTACLQDRGLRTECTAKITVT